MLPAPCYLFSDAHLGAAVKDTEKNLVAFLRHVGERKGSLVINGDLFDFWFEWKRVIPRGHFRTLAALADLRDAGVPVLMLGGNHDCWGGSVLTDDVGIDFQLGSWNGSVAGWRTRIDHGDGLREVEDRKYRRLRAVLRHPWSIKAFRWIHPDWSSQLAHSSSDASRNTRARDGGKGLRQVALAQLTQDPSLELIVFGHSHVAALERSSTGAVYANPGAWLDRNTFLVIRPERVELRQWDGSAEGELLNALDRRTQELLPVL